MDIFEVFARFPKQDDCIAYLEKVRWQGTPRCPYCKSSKQTPLPKEHRYHCNSCNTSYGVTVKTIFHRTRLPLQKWLLAVSLILNAKKGISARQLARHLKVNRNTAWRIGMQVRDAMYQPEHRNLLCGIVEMDETYVGGKPRRGSGKDVHIKHKCGRGTSKIPVVGMVERKGQVYAKVFGKSRLTLKKFSALVREKVDIQNTILMTDQYRSYLGMSRILPHKSIDHSIWYVRGDIHTNTIESFWALLKRGIVGQYHKVSLRHLPKYVDEFCYRYNHREQEDVFSLTIQRSLGAA
jgi:transposase-like protein